MEFLEVIWDIVTNFSEYIFGFFSSMIEIANTLLSNGNLSLFVLFILIIWKIVAGLKG